MGCSQGGGARVSGRSAGSADLWVPCGVSGAAHGLSPLWREHIRGLSLTKPAHPDLTRLSVVCKLPDAQTPPTHELSYHRILAHVQPLELPLNLCKMSTGPHFIP